MSANAAVIALAEALRHPVTGVVAQLAAMPLVPADLRRPTIARIVDDIDEPWVARGGSLDETHLAAGPLLIVARTGPPVRSAASSDEMLWLDVPVTVIWAIRTSESNIAEAQAPEVHTAVRAAVLAGWSATTRNVGRCEVRAPYRTDDPQLGSAGSFGDTILAYPATYTPAVFDSWAHAAA